MIDPGQGPCDPKMAPKWLARSKMSKIGVVAPTLYDNQ